MKSHPGSGNCFRVQLCCLALASLTGLLASRVHAANGNDTWLGNSSVNWSTAANWASGSVNKPPLAGDSLFFGLAGSSGASLNDDLTAGTVFNAITFSAGADALTLSGNSINLAGNVSDQAANTETVNLPLAMTGNRVCIVTNGGNLVLGGVISGTGFNFGVNTTTAVGNTLTPVNSGTVTLNGASVNTYTGATVISGGTLLLDFANLATPVNLINSGSALTMGGLGGGTLSIKGKASGATSQTFGNVSLSKNFGTSIVLNPNGGGGTTLTLGNTWNRNGGANSLNIDLSAGGTLTSTPTGVAANNVLGFATVKDATGTGLASLSGGNVVRLTGQTTLPTTGANAAVNYQAAGNTTMNAASFAVNSLTIDASTVPGALNLGGASDVMTLTSLGLLMSGANNYAISNGQVGANNSEVIVHQMGSGTLTINATLSSGIGGLTKNGPGTLVLGGTNAGSFVTINQGTVKQGATQALGSTNLSFIANFGATLDLNGFNLGVGLVANSGAGQGTVTNSGALASFMAGDSGNAANFANTMICGPINLILTGGGAIGLSPGNTHSGGTTFQNNTGAASNYRVNVASELGTGPLIFNGGGTIQNTTSLLMPNAVVVNGTGNTWWVDAGAYGSTGPWSGSGTINILQDASKSPSFTFSGDLSGFQGTLQLTANTNASASGLTCTYSLGGAGTFDGSHATWNLSSTLNTFSSSPVLQWAGAGSQTIRLGDLNTAGTTGTGNIIVSNNVPGTTATFEVGNLNNNSLFAGTIAGGTGSIALTKVGTGTWTLSSANTYTGATTVNNGALMVNGSLAAGSAVTVAGGTLGGAGTVGGSVTFSAGSHILLTGGTVLTVGGSLTVAGSGSLPDVHLAISNNVPSGNYTLATYNPAGSSGAFNSTPVLDSGSFAAGTRARIVTSAGSVVLQVAANHPPVAAAMTVTRTAGLNLLISLANLATNWSDADGDPVELTGINLTTTNGVSLELFNASTNTDGSIVVTNSTYIGCLNAPNVNDQFSYTISDGLGGTNTGLVNIVVDPFMAGQMTGSVAVGNGAASVTFQGIPGYTYITERATNLAPAAWVDISTNAAAANGAIDVNDSFGDLGAPPSSAYYRLKWQP